MSERFGVISLEGRGPKSRADMLKYTRSNFGELRKINSLQEIILRLKEEK